MTQALRRPVSASNQPDPLSPQGERITTDPRSVISPWKLACWVWGQQRARAILDRRDGPADGVHRGESTDGCAAIERIGRLGCRVDTSIRRDVLDATTGLASRLDDDAVLVHCRVLGTGGAALALVVHYAEQEQRPPRELPVTTWKPILARNGKARVYDPRVETHDTVRQPMDPANPENPMDRGYAPAEGRYCKVFPDPSDKDRLDARDTWRLFTEGLAALAALLADQPLKRWRVERGKYQ